MWQRSFLFLVIILWSCKGQSQRHTGPQLFIKEVIDLLRNNSIYKHHINWTGFSDSVFSKAKHAQTIAETYPAITFAVSLLNDKHSYFRAVNDTFQTSKNKALPILADEVTPAAIGYVRVPFCIGNQEAVSRYISTIQTKIKQQNKPGLKGWIVDLRGNFGGNKWPMLLALKPLLGNGTVGYFINADKQKEAWILKNGHALINDTLVEMVDKHVELHLTHLPVAVLINNQTASSGEAVAIAFKGRLNTKFLGQATFGVSTGCVSHQLTDGSVINLAQSIFADRNLNEYGHKILPDLATENENTLKQAIGWLYSISN